MLDINLFREDKGGDPEKIRESQRRRYADVGLVDRVVELDTEWRDGWDDKPTKGLHFQHGPFLHIRRPDAVRGRLDTAKMEFNRLVAQIKDLRKAKQDATQQQEDSKAMKAGIKELEEREKQLEAERDETLVKIGNLVHDSVPVSDNEDNNVTVKSVGEARQEGGLYNHVDLVQMLGIAELDQGTVVAGSRGYYLKGEGVLLNQALINYALQFSVRRGATPVQTPFFMQCDVMAECAQLSQFDEELYRVSGEGADKYLIATAEQPLCALHRKGWFEPGTLPVRYVGYSTCFRKEAGSHGRDTLGIFRVHQFEKVEQFSITEPTDGASWREFDAMIANAEEFYSGLGLPYRVVNIVSGELNNAAAKKYDLEAWFPASQTYRELVSCSNCLDYQSRRLDIRLRTPKGPAGETRKDYVHLLNATLTATERTLCCLLENYQTPEGLRIPEVLQPFMMGTEFIKFKNPPPTPKK